MWTRGTVKMSRLLSVAVIVVALALLLSGAARAQVPGGAWATRAPMPTARHKLAAAALDGKVYAVGGIAESMGRAVATVEAYDPATQTWAARAPMPTARYHLAAAAVNGKLYAVGGANPLHTSAVEEYDPATDTWATRASLPAPRDFLAVAAANGKLYAVGGIGGVGTRVRVLTTVEEYDPATDHWTTRAPMPTPRAYAAAVAGADGKLCVVGGTNDDALLATVEEYDPGTDTWTTGTSMPTARSHLGLAAVDGRLYAIGGRARQGTPPMESYDPAMDGWTVRSPTPVETADGAGVAAVDGKVYVVGGCGLKGCPSAQVDEFDPAG